MPTLPRRRHFLLLLPALLVLAMYFPTLGFGKIWDDWRMLGGFASYTDPAYWPQVLSAPLPFSDNYYRPLVVATFVLEAYWGLGDFHSHLFNVLLHGLNSALVIVAALALWPRDGSPYRRPSAVGMGVLFGLHQVMSEGVVWLVGRFDLMVTTCFLLAIIIDATVHSPVRKALLAALVFLAGLLCKEMAVTLPVTLLLLHAARLPSLAWKHVFSRDRILLYAALTAALCVYFLIRYSALGYLLTPEQGMAYVNLGTPLERLLLVGATYIGYLNVMFLPGAVSPLHYSPLPIAATNLSAWLGLGAIAGTLALTWFLIRKPATRVAGCCLLAMFVSLLPVLQIMVSPMVLADTYLADRAAIVPIVFLLLGLGSLLAQVATRQRVSMAFAAAAGWLAVTVPVVVLSLPIWQYDASLWKYIAETNPECSHCRTTHARLTLYTASPVAALKEIDLAMALARQPWQRALASLTRGAILMKMGRAEEALAAVVLAEQLDPVPASKHMYRLERLGILIEMGRLAEAQQVHDAFAGTEHANSERMKILTGKMAIAKGRPDIARQMFYEARHTFTELQRDAYHALTSRPADWRRLGDMFTEQKNPTAAAAAYKEAARLSALPPPPPASN